MLDVRDNAVVFFFWGGAGDREGEMSCRLRNSVKIRRRETRLVIPYRHIASIEPIPATPEPT